MLPGTVTGVDRTGEGVLKYRSGGSWVTKDRCVRRLAGFGVGLNFGVHTNGIKNLARGIVERVFYITRGEGLGTVPQPLAGVFSNRLSSIRQRLVRSSCRTPVVSREEYPALYNGRKRRVYQAAVDSLAVEAISPRDAVVSTFVKAEKVNLSVKADPAPRVIQPRTPRYNVEVGRYLKLFESSLCVGFERVFGYKVILKGMNASQVGEQLASNWDQFVAPVAVGLDATRFDQHVSRAALEWEHSVYNGVFRSAELRRLLGWQLHNRGVAFAEGKKISYEVEGKRMSGDINTGMGNCLLMSSMVLSYCEAKGVKARLANNGDDCVLFMEKGDLQAFDGIDKWMLDFGFTLTREEPVDVLEQVSFCQAHPVHTSTGWRMCRDPRVSMSKDMVALHGWGSELEVKYWLHTIGTCGLALATGVPVLGVWYGRLAELGVKPSQAWVDNIGASGFSYMSRGVTADSVISDETRVSFYRAFSITPEQQLVCEAEYRTLTTDFTPRPVMLSSITATDLALNPLSIIS